MLKPADGIEAFLADSAGRYVAGRTWLYWRADAELVGFVLWGRPDEDDVRRLLRVLDVEQGPGVPRHVSLVDARRLEGVDSNAFAALADFLAPRWKSLGEALARQAVVRPSKGLAGTVVAGFYQVLVPPYSVRVFAEPLCALPWLGQGSPQLVAELDRLQEKASGAPAVVRAVRDAVRPRLATVDLPSVARSLGMSERTLQRRLNEAGTTFQTEYHHTQLACAEPLLLDTDMKLTAVALEVGCASLQHFSALFRKHYGESPSAWRLARRPGTSTDGEA